MKDLRWTDVESSGCGRQVNFKIKMVTAIYVSYSHDMSRCYILSQSMDIERNIVDVMCI